MKKPDLNTCTVQEACDYAIKQMVKQGRPCTDGYDCLYADHAGNHCAIGWLLDPNDEELMGFFGTLPSLLSDMPDKVPHIIRNNSFVFSALQTVHDIAFYSKLEYIKTPKQAVATLQNKYGVDTSGPHWQKWVQIANTCRINLVQ